MDIHAHVSTESRDCDGGHGHDYVIFPNDAEIAESRQEFNDFSEISFMNRVFANSCGPYAVTQMDISVTEVGFQWNQATDEGYSGGQVTWCHEDCSDKSSQFDQFAELMGY